MGKPTRESFEAITHSAISVVNAIPAGRGVTIAIDLPCKVNATLRKKTDDHSLIVKTEVSDPHRLVERSIRYALRRLNFKIPSSLQLEVKIRSHIPTGVGLKSSSAVSVAATKAIFGLFSKDGDSRTILKSSCLASKDSRASLTGAYDDAAASLLGGVAFTDNSKFKLIRHSKMPEEFGATVAILVPKKDRVLTSSLSSSSYAGYRNEGLEAFRFAEENDFTNAMLLNSIIQCAALNYSMEPIWAALTEGASASGITGKGPAVAAICKSAKILRRVKREWRKQNKDKGILTAKVIQPERKS